ncbi:precorrin-2 C(20)-methyltransferase [Anaerocolumna sp.]|uniref:precorrin-2 C(20)-methyltransferase n=1 Tax=Anaerocolumna sp. TaxID=2041569 RepID=UPI0028B09638|nr:precorrin-2 C(20)-methyltransferase [Anaerocolumna sp.]
MSNILYGVGVGPGDPELLTLKALRCIKESDVIVLPTETKEECYAYHIVEKVYPQIEKKEIVCMPFPMIKDKEKLKKVHNEIYKQIAKILAKNKTVAFLVIGDPSIYSTYSYIHSKVIENKGTAIMINGIPSFCAVAAALGISLGDNRDEIHIIPGSYDVGHTLELEGTKIYMKSGKKLEELKKAILDYKDLDCLEVYAVSNCGMKDEAISIGVNNLDTESSYLTIVIVKEKV